MTIQEFSDQFDVHFNNITSNQAPGVNEYEKCVYLTKAEKEIVLDYFTANSKGNNIGQGYDDSAKRQADFSCLMKTSYCLPLSSQDVILCVDSTVIPERSKTVLASNITLTPIGSAPALDVTSLPLGVAYSVDNKILTYSENVTYRVDGFPYIGGTLTRQVAASTNTLDPRSLVYIFPTDTFIIINEAIETSNNHLLQVLPLRYDEYLRLMSKPFKRPLKNQAWRLLNSGINSGSTATKYVEIIANTWDENKISSYNIRYVRVPKPIIVAPLDGLTIDGYYGTDANGNPVTDPATAVVGGMECELDPILHEAILQRAVELAKIAWTATGNENSQLVVQAGQRSE
jgi:hypothetical protein